MEFGSPIDEVLGECSRLILTDAFPPYAAGGAELSLAASLKSLSPEERASTCILCFTPKVTAPSVSTYDSAIVLHLPEPLAWPYNTLGPKEVAKMHSRKGLPARLRGRLERELRSRFGKNANLERIAYSESAYRPVGGILTDYLLSPEDRRVDLALSVSRCMDLKVLVCDNTRSILIGSIMLELLGETPFSSAIVRDNRFHCARPSQSRMVGSEFCSDCRFQCASEDTRSGGTDIRKEALGLTQEFRAKALNRFSQVIVTSHELARHVRPVVDPQIPVNRIPNGLGSFDVIDSWTEGVPQSHRSEIVIIGMLNENKGQLQFMRAAAEWIRENPDVRINFLGRGSRIGKKIKELSRDANIESQVRLLGYRPRKSIFEEMARAKLIVAPTVWPEPFGRVPIEAGAARRAVVAFGVGGINESIINDKTGILVSPGDYAALVRAIDGLLTNAAKRVELQENARAWVEANYSMAQTTDKFAEKVFRIPPLAPIERTDCDNSDVMRSPTFMRQSRPKQAADG